MTDNQKLIDDAVTAYTDREITPPSRDNLRIALEAFEASLKRCGCDTCTTARRERIALTDHDRTAMARVLHEIVYSPGATYDRAVPGIQEHLLACAEKVAAALPWLAPPSPADDEREALIEQATWALVEWDTDTADRGVSDEHYRVRRAEVERVFPILFGRPAPQGEPCDLVRRLVDLRGDMRHNADEVAALDLAIAALSPQGEPSDAQIVEDQNQ